MRLGESYNLKKYLFPLSDSREIVLMGCPWRLGMPTAAGGEIYTPPDQCPSTPAAISPQDVG